MLHASGQNLADLARVCSEAVLQSYTHSGNGSWEVCHTGPATPQNHGMSASASDSGRQAGHLPSERCWNLSATGRAGVGKYPTQHAAARTWPHDPEAESQKLLSYALVASASSSACGNVCPAPQGLHPSLGAARTCEAGNAAFYEIFNITLGHTLKRH